ncbi:DUF6541 family protein [Arthrobacter antibioticus]|uniref:DUF6541 family protein n=1 Tax=Arthrobacter sp. H35-MC1 TaxID=3046203 RepID=UPI0024BA89B6|nr:DUF6541 family protein [Arthrobacter sp. H35-MC1]MDJ0316484.1 hypothetical protein [Arthrobacter sp. H35-MC1]
MTWLATLPTIVACVILLFAPGLVFGTILGLRGLSLLASSPVITVAFTSVTAILCGAVGIRWSVVPVVITVLAASLVVWFLKWCVNRTRSVTFTKHKMHFSHAGAIQSAGFVIGSLTIARQLTRVFGAPMNISQSFDNIFHLNAVRYILETGNASSMTVAAINSGDLPPTFYPAAWHGLAALLIQLTGSPLSVSVNVLNLTIAALVWTLGCMFLTRVIVGQKPWAVAFAGVLAASFSSFPILLLDFGVLYPNFLAIAMLPFALATVAIFFGLSTDFKWVRAARYAAAPVSAIALAIAHPNGFMTLLALSLPIILVAFWRRYFKTRFWRAHKGETVVIISSLIIASVVLARVWDSVRPPAEASTWAPRNLPASSIGEILTNSAMGRPAAWIVSILMVVGIYAAIRAGNNGWLLGCFMVTSALFVIVSSFPQADFRSAITGVWYNDSFRLAAILPVTALPLAALGFDWIHQLVKVKTETSTLAGNVVDRVSPKVHFGLRTVAGVLVLVFLAIGLQGSAMKFANRSAAMTYEESEDAALVSIDELALITKLDRLVPADDVIAVSPWTGAAMAFALGDRWTTSMHTLSTYSHNVEIINAHLRDAATDPEVCLAVKATRVRYVLDFGAREVHGGRHVFAGLDNLENSSAFELVSQVGEAKLYKLIAC